MGWSFFCYFNKNNVYYIVDYLLTTVAYLYRHIRLDKNEPFYIGIGSDLSHRRAKEKSRRNNIWKKVVAKTDYEVEILFDDLTWDQVKIKEIEFIKLYGRLDNGTGTLANLTDGGDGTVGLIVNEEGRKRSSRVHFNKITSEETKAKISQALKLKHKPAEEIKRFVNESLKYSKSIRKKVLCISTGNIFESANEAALFFGVTRTYICRQITGKRKNKFNLKYI